MQELTTKRSPIVLIWKFAAVEVVGFVLYFFATLLGNAKYELYAQSPLQSFLSYQAAKMIFLLGAQFAFTVYAFLSWYYEDFTVRPHSVWHTKGVFLRKERTFPINDSTTFSISASSLGRLLHYGSVRLKTGDSSIVLPDISRPKRVIGAIREELHASPSAFGEAPDIKELLKKTENERLEFKSSLRFDYKAGNVSRELEKAAMKTIAAFLNSKGGYLVLGVSDTRAPLGLQNDYRTLQRKDSDGFENHFTQAMNSMIGPEFRSFIKLWFYALEGHDLCVIQALPSPRPVYLKIDNSEHFYMRTGNISTSLKLSEIESYSRSRWPQHS